MGVSATLTPANGLVHPRIQADRTSIVIYGNKGLVSLAACVLPHDGEQSVQIESTDADSELTHLSVHTLHSAWITQSR